MLMLMFCCCHQKLLSHTLHWHGIAPAAAAGTAHSFQTTRHLGRVGSLLTSPHPHTYIHNHLWGIQYALLIRMPVLVLVK